jgi:hypothetical protein
MKAIGGILIFVVSLGSCVNQDANNHSQELETLKEENEQLKDQISEMTAPKEVPEFERGDYFEGDFNGDGLVETATYFLKEIPGDYESVVIQKLTFSDPAIPEIVDTTSSSLGYLASYLNEGNLDARPGDEISVTLSRIEHGDEPDLMSCLRLSGGKWETAFSFEVVPQNSEPGLSRRDRIRQGNKEREVLYYESKLKPGRMPAYSVDTGGESPDYRNVEKKFTFISLEDELGF